MKIYQLTNTTAYQMMCYIIVSDDNKVIVIDGGNYGQSDELMRILTMVGGKVDMWFLTHIHDDHFGAIAELFENNKDIDKIECKNGIMRNAFAGNWEDYSEVEVRDIKKWIEFENKSGLLMNEISAGDVFKVGNITAEVIAQARPEITVNACNNQSCVLKLSDDSFSFIILGDLGSEGGKLLLEEKAEEIKADGVQMAHHGQYGVDRDVYEAIGASYAFWPTPKWLWDNTEYLGGTPGNGSFQTPEVIGWMKELGTENITCFEKTVMFDTNQKKVFYV